MRSLLSVPTGFFYSGIPGPRTNSSQLPGSKTLPSLLSFLVRTSIHLRLAFMSLSPMAASSQPTDESSPPYGTLSNDQDFDWMISDAKFAAGTRIDFYDRSLTNRKYALVGVACSSIFSCSCIVAGSVILANHGIMGTAMINPNVDALQDILTLILNLTVTLCTESIIRHLTREWQRFSFICLTYNSKNIYRNCRSHNKGIDG
ncbi:hypothetical protein BD769DRAFT_4251 [Suillus cothurnatus]|nr:hypothetical protein BD769DRAFT_4251 [Suillus cothurnatus]